MEYPRQITVIQTTAILISTITGIGVLGIPRVIAEAAGTGAPLVTGLGALLAVTGVVFLIVLGWRFPRQSIIAYSEDILGKWLARLGSVSIIVFFMISTAVAIRGFGDVVKTYILQETPLDLTIIMMLALAALSTRQDVNTFAYIHLFYLPLLVFPGLLVFPFALKDVDPLYLLPIWGNGRDALQMVGGVTMAAALFQGAFIITMIIPAMRRPEQAMRAGLWGVGIAGVLHVAVVGMALAMFGHEELQQIIWPTLELAKATRFPVLQRIDAAFLIGWLIVVFTTAYATYYIVVHAASDLFRLRDHRFLALFVFPFIYLIAMLPKNTQHYYDILQSVGKVGLCLTVVYPLLLWVVAVARGKRGKLRGK